MRLIASLLISSAIRAGHALQQSPPVYDPTTWEPKEGDNYGWPVVSNFSMALQGGSWDQISYYMFSFNVSIFGSFPFVSTSCMTNDYVFNPGCRETTFGTHPIEVPTKFDFVNVAEDTADLWVIWTRNDDAADSDKVWTYMNASHRITKQDMAALAQPGSKDVIFTYTGNTTFLMEYVWIDRPQPSGNPA